MVVVLRMEWVAFWLFGQYRVDAKRHKRKGRSVRGPAHSPTVTLYLISRLVVGEE